MWSLSPYSRHTAGTTTVADKVSGLEWQRAISTELFTLADAKSYCEGLALAGCGDWRLPSRAELLTIVSFSSYDPAINVTTFPDTPSEMFWSSSVLLDHPEAVWGVNFLTGQVISAGSSLPHFVRCVR